MNIQAEKISIIEHLLAVQDEKLLMAVKNLLEFGISRQDVLQKKYEDLPGHVRESISVSLRELEEGKGIPHEAVMSELKARFQQ
jgi:hypothetical protein